MGKLIERCCKNCHAVKKFTGSKYCDECAPMVRREQTNAWHAAHPERRKEIAQRKNERRRNNPEHKARERARYAVRYARYSAAPMPRVERRRDGQLIECLGCHRMLPHGQYSKCGIKVSGQPRRMARCKACRAPGEKVRVHARNHAPGKFTIGDIRDLERKQRMMCACNCGRSLHAGYHIDHILPLSKGGSNWPSNLQLLTPLCNMRKCGKPLPVGVPVQAGNNRRQRSKLDRAAWLRRELARVGAPMP